jgi:hypothetical protein
MNTEQARVFVNEHPTAEAVRAHAAAHPSRTAWVTWWWLLTGSKPEVVALLVGGDGAVESACGLAPEDYTSGPAFTWRPLTAEGLPVEPIENRFVGVIPALRPWREYAYTSAWAAALVAKGATDAEAASLWAHHCAELEADLTRTLEVQAPTRVAKIRAAANEERSMLRKIVRILLTSAEQFDPAALHAAAKEGLAVLAGPGALAMAPADIRALLDDQEAQP